MEETFLGRSLARSSQATSSGSRPPAAAARGRPERRAEGATLACARDGAVHRFSRRRRAIYELRGLTRVHAQNHFDVAVIGAGQAGLTMGYELAQQGRRFLIVEAADSVGAAWRARWDSLTPFPPRRYDSLPGLEFPGDPDGYPGRDEVIAYLENYAKT